MPKKVYSSKLDNWEIPGKSEIKLYMGVRVEDDAAAKRLFSCIKKGDGHSWLVGVFHQYWFRCNADAVIRRAAGFEQSHTDVAILP